MQWNLCMKSEKRDDLWRCGGCVERRKRTGGLFVEISQTRKHVLKSRVADSEATNHNDVCFSQQMFFIESHDVAAPDYWFISEQDILKIFDCYGICHFSSLTPFREILSA